EVPRVDAQNAALGQQLGQLSLVLRKPGEEQNIPSVETVSLDDLRYSLRGSAPPGARPAAASAPTPPVRRLILPRRAAPVVRHAIVPATNTVSVTRGVETKDYEVGGYAQ